MALDPIKTTEVIRNRYLSYIETTLKINNPEIQSLFIKELRKDLFINGPILEATPPFKMGVTISDLINEGILSPEFKRIGHALPVDRPLYLHQERAVRKATHENRNIIVATGTGSGKTEVFLIPILNHLFREMENKTISNGVRSLLLYPLNALANDQLERMRNLLENIPEITFGRFTGETKETYKEAMNLYKKRYNRNPLPNEMISREQMRVRPPHILLTNYAMLEYLLLRPNDTVFFDGDDAKFWRFVVIDEIHTFNGAKGIEMAMLLRRLKDRVVRSQKGKLCCIGTSATLGDGENSFPNIAAFTEKLFGEVFIADDVISAERLSSHNNRGEWKADPELYSDLLSLIENDMRPSCVDIKRVLERYVIPNQLLQKTLDAIDEQRYIWLYHLLRGDENLHQLKRILQDSPMEFKVCANEIFSDYKERIRSLSALVELAHKASHSSESEPLLAARYHLFIRAINGAYIQFVPDKRVFLIPTITNNSENECFQSFELGSCKHCGALFILGTISNEAEQKDYFRMRFRHCDADDMTTEDVILSLDSLDNYGSLDEDEVIESSEDAFVNVEYMLCGKCGAIQRADALRALCSCDTSNVIPVYRIESSDPEKKISRCPFCSKSSPSGGDLVIPFLLGRDAPTSVIATALYQELPKKSYSINTQSDYAEDDPWAAPTPVSTINQSVEYPGSLLVFSDSRQDAAFFAPYLNRTYDRLLRRHMIHQCVIENQESIQNKLVTIDDLFAYLNRYVEDTGIFSAAQMSATQREELLKKWIFAEVTEANQKGSLESLGLIGFTSTIISDVNNLPLTQSPWSLNNADIIALFSVLLDTIRTNKALYIPETPPHTDEYFSPGNVNFSISIDERRILKDNKVLSFVPQPSRDNKRLDYLKRVAEKIGIALSDTDLRGILGNIGKFLQLTNGNPEIWYRDQNVDNPAYRIRGSSFSIVSPITHSQRNWYRCDRCGHVTIFNVKSVCPSYRCYGTLIRFDPLADLSKNHYTLLVKNLKPIALHAEEHTAQLTHDEAGRIQQEFIEGRVNVLSCSTTFELGVDVGDLESVFMRNMPPTAANYIQRAGRAGRRSESTAFVVTYCQNRPHDLARYINPRDYVAGIIKPPYFTLENEKILLRHVNAVAIADFWKKNPDTFGKITRFFGTSDDLESITRLKDYLQSKPVIIQDALKRIVPAEVQNRLGIHDWSFIHGLFNLSQQDTIPLDDAAYIERTGLLEVVRDEYIQELQTIRELIDEAYDNNKPTNHFLGIIKTIQKRNVIDYLSSKNILPQYGFPIDVVKLEISPLLGKDTGIKLERDLKIAVNEYAPGNRIVAGGKIWESGYLKKWPRHNWRQYNYLVCPTCKRFYKSVGEIKESICDVCQTPLPREVRTFIIPEFGFITSNKKPSRAGERREAKRYLTQVYFTGESEKWSEEHEIKYGNLYTVRAQTDRRGKIVVLNRGDSRGFFICNVCGFGLPNSFNNKLEKHKNPNGKDCRGSPLRNSGNRPYVDLGHEYFTDILKIDIEGNVPPRSDNIFWYSLLYALLEGASLLFDIERTDLDGCLFSNKKNNSNLSIILFDNVPGGAGHMARIGQNKGNIKLLFEKTKDRLNSCNCGAACYGCLKNYNNQCYHHYLDRLRIIEFLNQVVDD